MDWDWNSFRKRFVMLAGIFPEWKIYKYRLFFQMCYCFMFFCRQGLKAKKRVTKLVFVVIIVFIGKFNYSIVPLVSLCSTCQREKV
jgi:hypothetical protein